MGLSAVVWEHHSQLLLRPNREKPAPHADMDAATCEGRYIQLEVNPKP